MRFRLLVSTALLGILPGLAGAQFTTFVPPPRPVEPARAAEQIAGESARADTLRQERLAGMRAWVDSAAVALAARPDTMTRGPDTVSVAELPARPRPVRPREPTREFREGAPAPATATGLPVLALFGIGALGVGAFLLGSPWRRGA